jgi:hypothetical protein
VAEIFPFFLGGGGLSYHVMCTQSDWRLLKSSTGIFKVLPHTIGAVAFTMLDWGLGKEGLRWPRMA